MLKFMITNPYFTTIIKIELRRLGAFYEMKTHMSSRMSNCSVVFIFIVAFKANYSFQETEQ